MPRAPRSPLRPAVAVESSDPIADARAAGLRYVSNARPGIVRMRSGRGFTYRAPDGTTVRDAATLRRIRSLAIPPAWTDVWICPDPRGHLQAVGHDARGRKQYRYHPAWRAVRDSVKFDRLLRLAECLPAVRAQTDLHLRQPVMSRERVLASVVCLLERTRIRVGNEEYRRQNRSFGLTTLRNRHAVVEGTTIRFEFRGKSGRLHSVRLSDARLARVVRRCQELPGQELFQYLDARGERHRVDSDDVNAYLREVSGGDFTAKDFRTWAGTVEAAAMLRRCTRSEDARERRSEVVRAVAEVAAVLGNTPTVCRKSYIHPAVLQAFEEGWLPTIPLEPAADDPHALSEDERFAVALLRHVERAAARAAARAA